MKILIPLHGFIEWNGGLDLIRLLSAILESGEDRNVEIVYAVPEEGPLYRALHSLAKTWQRFRSRASSAISTSPRLPAIAMEIIGGRDWHSCGRQGADIARLADAIKADVIFPSLIPIKKCDAVRIGYIFDFQHLHLPDLFSRRIIRKRNRQFAEIAAASDGIIVNSDFVRRDVISCLNYDQDKIFKLPFMPFKNQKVTIDPEGALDKYKISRPYLIVCNHFWVHKDHETALRAFSALILIPEFSELSLVLTGDPVDHRNPSHYAQLLALSKSLGISGRTHFLGLIPKADQLSLLNGARLLVQPTRYEGGPGGGAVYEAMGNGIPAVVSDISINREIGHDAIVFFAAGQAEDLKSKIILALSQKPRFDLGRTPDEAMKDASDSLIRFMAEIRSTRDVSK
jgi:glycosyltransferase involved in cell wall biosynthesis